MLNVEMLSTGDEVLHGQIIDTNAAWLADLDVYKRQGLARRRRAAASHAALRRVWHQLCAGGAWRRTTAGRGL